MEQIVKYKNYADNGSSWSHAWASGRAYTPRFDDIEPMYWT